MKTYSLDTLHTKVKEEDKHSKAKMMSSNSEELEEVGLRVFEKLINNSSFERYNKVFEKAIRGDIEFDDPKLKEALRWLGSTMSKLDLNI